MQRNVLETIMGGVVLAVAAFFLVFAYTSSDIARVGGYELYAKFDRVDGLQEGSDVRLSGIKVGTVVNETLEPETYLAVLTLSIDPRVTLPADTVAKIMSDGLLGGKYLALDPGGDERMLQPGDEIQFTQSSINLEDLIGRYIFSSGGEKEKQGAEESDPAP